MKVIGIVGSPRRGGNTDVLVSKILEGAENTGSDTEIFYLNELTIKGCQACMYCRQNDGCAIKDDMQKLYTAIESADAVVIGSAIYMNQITSQTKAFMDRLFPYLNPDFSAKIKKKTLVGITMGGQNTAAMTPYITHTTDALGALGFPVKEVIIEGGLYIKGEIAGRKEFMHSLIETGEKILKQERDWAD